MHDRAVRLDRPSDDIVGILEVNNDDFGLRILVNLLSHAYVVIRFEGLDRGVNETSLSGIVSLTHELKPMDACCLVH